MAALQSELNFALEAADKVPAIGVVREQERVLAEPNVACAKVAGST